MQSTVRSAVGDEVKRLGGGERARAASRHSEASWVCSLNDFAATDRVFWVGREGPRSGHRQAIDPALISFGLVKCATLR